MPQPKGIEEAKAKLLEKAATVKRVLATPDGKILLEILRKEFLTSLAGKDQTDVIFNAGRADVVAYLLSLNAVEVP
jgi:hypothetical protein